jgi:membrane-associated phospholipid phosphatase
VVLRKTPEEQLPRGIKVRVLGPVLDLLARLRGNLSPAGYFGLQMTAGLLVFAAAAWLFGGIAEDVVTGDSHLLHDLEVERWFHLHQTARLNGFLSGVSRLHEWPGVACATGLLVLYFLWRHNWRWVTTIICAVPGGMILDALLKIAFHRARPTLSSLATILRTYSFPSGHVMAATLIYGVLAAYATTRLVAWQSRVVAVLIACSLVAVIAFSRVYLGVHYLSDVLAAASAGVTWLALCLMAIDKLWYPRGRHHNIVLDSNKVPSISEPRP